MDSIYNKTMCQYLLNFFHRYRMKMVIENELWYSNYWAHWVRGYFVVCILTHRQTEWITEEVVQKKKRGRGKYEAWYYNCIHCEKGCSTFETYLQTDNASSRSICAAKKEEKKRGKGGEREEK